MNNPHMLSENDIRYIDAGSARLTELNALIKAEDEDAIAAAQQPRPSSRRPKSINPRFRLTVADVKNIRALGKSGLRVCTIRALYYPHVARNTIWAALNGRSWAYV